MYSFLLKPQDRESCKGLGPTGSLQAGVGLQMVKTRPGRQELITCPSKALAGLGQVVKAPQQLAVLVVASII